VDRESIVPPAAEQPDIVEARLGVREYWYETFRRVLVVPEDGGVTLSVDVYRKLDSLPEGYAVEDSYTLARGLVRVYYLSLPKQLLAGLKLRGSSPSRGWLVVVEARTRYGERRLEAVNVRLVFEGLDGLPGRDEVWQVYREVVKAVEGRDPQVEPLKQPEPVERVYASRLGAR
jgi:hypothetical protein